MITVGVGWIDWLLAAWFVLCIALATILAVGAVAVLIVSWRR